MPRAWRIVKERYAASAFSGEGAALNGGRWNSHGVRVVYASATKSLAALELLVHLNPPVFFRYRAYPIEFDDKLVEYLPRADLPPDWRSEPPAPSTQVIGDRWVRATRSVVLAVPSVLIRDEANYLLNPAHPDFRKVQIGESEEFALDPRLLS